MPACSPSQERFFKEIISLSSFLFLSSFFTFEQRDLYNIGEILYGNNSASCRQQSGLQAKRIYGYVVSPITIRIM